MYMQCVYTRNTDTYIHTHLYHVFKVEISGHINFKTSFRIYENRNQHINNTCIFGLNTCTVLMLGQVLQTEHVEKWKGWLGRLCWGSTKGPLHKVCDLLARKYLPR